MTNYESEYQEIIKENNQKMCAIYDKYKDYKPVGLDGSPSRDEEKAVVEEFKQKFGELQRKYGIRKASSM